MAKGEDAEELLRDYFRSLGYYVARGARFDFDDVEVTDIDLWLYGRPSPLSRERINVDIKNKKTPQAIERVFWASGVRSVLDLTSCIVVTTDRRKTVVDFGREHNVVVIDGSFLEVLRKRPVETGRLTEEELISEINKDSLKTKNDNWADSYHVSKSRLLTHLDYDGCNRWLVDVEQFIRSSVSDTKRQTAAVRCAYLMISHFEIALDFMVSKLGVASEERRKEALLNGFRFGNYGETRARVLDELFSAQGRTESERETLFEAADTIPVWVLAEHFSRGAITNRLFDEAKMFDEAAFSKSFVEPKNLPSQLKSTFAAFLDFGRFDRTKFL